MLILYLRTRPNFTTQNVMVMKKTKILLSFLFIVCVQVGFAFSGGLGKDKGRNAKKGTEEVKLSLSSNNYNNKKLTLGTINKYSFLSFNSNESSSFVVKSKVLIKKGNAMFLMPVRQKIVVTDKLTLNNLKKLFKN